MSAITIENDLVHYEVLGRGRPVILLHGWLGSWRYWVPSMQQLSAKYRAYALDLWGFGDSGKEPKRFDFASQVALLDQFMEKMGISKAALVGHDLGAAVATRYATLHPDRVPRLMVVSPPLFQMAPSSTVLNIPPLTSQQIAAASGTPSLTAGAAANAAASAGTTASGAATGATASAGGTAPGAGSNATPAAVAGTTANPAANTTPGAATATAPGTSVPVQSEAETMPWRTEEIRERIRQAVDVQAKQLGEAALAGADATNALKPKTALEATTPPADKPAAEVVTSAPAPAATGTVQSANPLKAQLGTLNRMELLEKHVEVGTDRDKLKIEVEKAHDKALEMSIESFAGVDTLRELIALTMPIVAVSGVNDTFVLPPNESMQQSLKDGAGQFLYVPMEATRHFPMLENITGFTRLLLDFLEVPDVTKIEIKKLWERRVR